MNEKERIIELVKNNVISIEEALDLLESNGHQTEPKPMPSSHSESNTRSEIEDVIQQAIDQGKQWVHEVSHRMQDSFNETEKEEVPVNSEESDQSARAERVAELDQRIQEGQQALSSQTDALTICEQRLRELEIFQELDDLTEEMQAQQETLLKQRMDLQTDIQAQEAQIASLEEERRALGGDRREEFRTFVEKETGRVIDRATQEGRRIGSMVSEKGRSFLDNFNLKEVKFDMQVPWLKTQKASYHYQYDVDAIETMNLRLNNGSLKIKAHDNDQIIIDAEVSYLGKHEAISEAYFESLVSISNQDNHFMYQVTNPRVAVDLTMQVPQVQYQSFIVNLLNGDLYLKDIKTDEMMLDSKNGDIKLKEVHTDNLTVEILNGSTLMQECHVNTTTCSQLNGDLRVKGPIRYLSADIINGDVLLTKEDSEDTRLKVKIQSGAIKVALPQEMGLDLSTNTSMGQVKSRLSGVTTEGNQQHLVRETAAEAPRVTGELKTSIGDIYLKDTVQSTEE